MAWREGAARKCFAKAGRGSDPPLRAVLSLRNAGGVAALQPGHGSANKKPLGRARGEAVRMSNVAVWVVHLFTASGAALAFLAAVATTHAHWQLVFIYLGAALIIDGVDGTIARGMRVSSR